MHTTPLRSKMFIAARPLRATLSTLLFLLGPHANAADDIAARVNGEIITQQQWDQELRQRQFAAKPSDPPLEADKVLEDMIVRKILAQKAIDRNIQTHPQVMHGLTMAREDILAQNYRSQAAPVPEPTDDEIKRYYDEHPGLFKKRRIYRIESMDLKEPVPDEAGLSRALKRSVSLPDLLKNYPKLQGVKFTTNIVMQAAEDLPLTVVEEFAKRKDGTVFELKGDSGYLSIHHIVASKEEPRSLQEAAPLIKRFLWQIRANDWFFPHAAELRRKADVTIYPR